MTNVTHTEELRYAYILLGAVTGFFMYGNEFPPSIKNR
jgi:hypothetical protein